MNTPMSHATVGPAVGQKQNGKCTERLETGSTKMTLNIDIDKRYWTAIFKLNNYEVATLLAALDNPPAGCNLETVEHLQMRLKRIASRKECS